MALHRTTIAVLSTGLLLAACDDNSPDKKVAEAREDYRQDVKDAKKIDDPQERAEELAEAKQEFNEERAEAYEDKERADADDTPAAGSDRERFAALKDETDAAFVARAKARIEAIDTEFEALDATKRDNDEVKDVQEKLAEARKDLSEFDGELGDGKLGVAVAINSAERQLDDLTDG